MLNQQFFLRQAIEGPGNCRCDYKTYTCQIGVTGEDNTGEALVKELGSFAVYAQADVTSEESVTAAMAKALCREPSEMEAMKRSREMTPEASAAIRFPYARDGGYVGQNSSAES